MISVASACATARKIIFLFSTIVPFWHRVANFPRFRSLFVWNRTAYRIIRFSSPNARVTHRGCSPFFVVEPFFSPWAREVLSIVSKRLAKLDDDVDISNADVYYFHSPFFFCLIKVRKKRSVFFFFWIFSPDFFPQDYFSEDKKRRRGIKFFESRKKEKNLEKKETSFYCVVKVKPNLWTKRSPFSSTRRTSPSSDHAKSAAFFLHRDSQRRRRRRRRG